MKTKVIFLIDKPADNFTGKDEVESLGVFAYFPEMVHNGDIMTCYAHIGQHSACHPDYAKECKEATPAQYLDLYEELISIGYDLRILNKKKLHTIDRIVHPVNSRYGAPMGRRSKGEKPENKKVFDCRVPLSNDGAYDRGGAYWGIGKELRVSYTKDLSFIKFYRKGEQN